MKILHVTPHLGGGVGKAHAALRGALPAEVEQTFVLLEAPRERSYANSLEQSGARVIVAENLDHVAQLTAAADIVQFEFWNHPRLFECLARCRFPAMRSVFWSHISGVQAPVIPPALMQEAMRFAFSTEASLDIAAVARLSAPARSKLAVINSGFGFPGTRRRRSPARAGKPAIGYLGTVDFVKMHPGFFEAVDRLAGDDIHASVWGAVDPAGAVAARAQAMRHSERVTLHGATADPQAALSAADIFFYPLQSDHYGTAENALVEAMSLGLVAVVLDNAAEMAIVRDGETGFVARSIAECTSLLQMLLVSPDLRAAISRNAAAAVAQERTPQRSAQDFMILWLGLLAKPARPCDFRAALGENPADWFLATQRLPGTAWSASRWKNAQQPSKGTLAHFESVFAGDASLARLRA
jgi:glycosyltransferase involved in cell wall biosynthesis